MQNLSIIILTKNEERNIAAAVFNAKQCTEIVIVIDAGSTDKTVMLAEQAGAKVIFRAWDNDFAAQRNFVLDKIVTEWVLYLDADERLNAQLIAAVNTAVASRDIDKQYIIKRFSHAFGQQFRHGVLRPDRVARLFPRKQVLWEGKVHERPVCTLNKGELAGHIEHYTYESWQQWWEKAGKYTTIWAADKYAQGKRTSLSSVLMHVIGGAIKVFIIQGGILEGPMGLVSTWQHMAYTLSKYMKLLELQRKND